MREQIREKPAGALFLGFSQPSIPPLILSIPPLFRLEPGQGLTSHARFTRGHELILLGHTTQSPKARRMFHDVRRPNLRRRDPAVDV